ncbi:MAG: NAD(P)/FAD-dependent oxidoreductase, partial [Chloroflexi bacterium]|nr:NAD(P)/FAD-dependent oxidoreductase [Chloroflexota bacterium]
MEGIVGKVFDEFPTESNWDVVVIGAGPNGLMTAAYLARAGAKVAIIERRYEVGGGLATEEILFPGYYSNMHAIYHMMVDYMPAIKDFNLDRHALVWIKPNLQMAMVFGDGSTLLLTRMLEDTVDSILKFSQKDAKAFGKHAHVWQRMMDEIVGPATYLPPKPSLDLIVSMQRTEIGRELLELNEKSPLQIMNECFENWKYDKWSYYTLHVVSTEMPKYQCDDPWANESFMTVIGFESTDQVVAHWKNVMKGKLDKNFGGHVTCESFWDPHLVRMPTGKVSFFQMHAPYDIEGGWEKRGQELQEATLDKWHKAAPNMKRESIMMLNGESPVDIEIRFPNMRRGGVKHGDYTPMQLGFNRPNIECSTSKTPIEGLYLCGASTYPGGMVTGGPGYIAANK